jgi:outer membrane protein assembly factor BamA
MNCRIPSAHVVFRAVLLVLFSSATVARAQQPPDETVPEPAQLEADGALIGAILIDPQNVFDTANPKEDKAVFRAANKLHAKTREHVIREQLLFHPGDRYQQHQLEESERILRSARYLYDASVRPVAYHDGRVDIAVTTRDVWTLNPGISFGRRGGANSVGFELEELNILGTGTSLSASHKSGVDRDSNAIEYKDEHLAGTWAALAARYADSSDGSTRGLSLERPFYALDSRWAAGISTFDDQRIESLYDRGRIVQQFSERESTATLFRGWSRGLIDGWTKRWTVGLTYDDEQFTRLSVGSAGGVIPENRKLVYPWIGFELIQDDFRTLHNRDQIGRTEDFYLGARLSAQLGWADRSFGSDRDALTFAASAGYGFGGGERSTWLLSGSTSGRLEQGDVRNALLNAAVRYYAKQSERRLFFATLETTAGSNLDLDTQILLGGDNGLRGYPLRYQSGDARALLTLEQRYFTNWYPLRMFRVGGAVFFDAGRTWGTSAVSSPSLGILKDVGVGLRIGNSRSGLGNLIHIDVAVPLDGDASIDSLQFLVETKQRF